MVLARVQPRSELERNTMPDMTNPLQPFMDLMQANMALLAKYAMSPNDVTQAMAQVRAAMTQGPGASAAPNQTPAMLAELAQGMMQNYTRFMTDLAQSGMASLSQGQSAMIQQVQDVADSASEGGRTRRSTRA
jgi:maltoporin